MTIGNLGEVSARRRGRLTNDNQRQFSQPRAEFVAKFSTTERPAEMQTSILQALTMMNGRFISDRASTDPKKFEATGTEESGNSLVAISNSPFMSTSDRIEALFLATLSRLPRAEELKKFTEFVDKGGPSGDKNKALADVFWALLNSSEFGFNH